MGKTKILQVTHDLGIGGLPRVVTTLVKGLDKNRFDVSVLCLNDTGPYAAEVEAAGARVIQLSRRGSRPDYFAFTKVARLLRKLDPAVVHTHNTQPFIDAGLGAIVARTPRLVHTDHARDFPDKKRYMVAERMLSRYAYRVVAVSDHTARNLVAFESIDPDKIITIYNGIVDPVAGAIDRAAKREELGVPTDALLLGVGVRFTEQKGLRYLLQAMPTVHEAVPNAHLLMAGYGPLAEELEKTAASLDIDTVTHFVGARLDMVEVLRALDVYVLPSVWEGLPMVLLEAMAAGVPVVASRVGGVPEAVEHETTGLLVQPRRPAELAAALIALLRDEERRRAYGLAARRAFEERFTAQHMTRRYAELYLAR